MWLFVVFTGLLICTFHIGYQAKLYNLWIFYLCSILTNAISSITILQKAKVMT